MKGLEWNISPAALLLFAVLYFFDDSGLYAAALPAVAVHEAGHFCMLHLGGLRPRRLSLGFFGLEMDYEGSLEGTLGVLAIAAGPLFGLAYSALMFSPWEYLRLSGGISLGLSLFNLLPVLPLDGGRLLEMAAGERGRAASGCLCVVLCCAAFWLLLSRGWFSFFAVSLWLLACNLRA